MSNASQWEKGREALLHGVMQEPRLTKAPPSNDTAVSEWDLKAAREEDVDHAHLLSLYLLGVHWPD